MMRVRFLVVLALISASFGGAIGQAADPLPSWNDGDAKQAILSFVAAVTREDSPDFVPPQERIATFDNDGTLWVEQPMYVQATLFVAGFRARCPAYYRFGRILREGGAPPPPLSTKTENNRG